MNNRFCLLLLVLFFNKTFSQTDSIDIYDFNFNQLSKLKITSATKAPLVLGEVPSTVIVITAQEIKEKGYFTLEDVLSDLPGFQFRNIQGINSYVFQRGIPNQNNLILLLIDGVQVNELNSGGFYAGGQYNLSNIERIEIVYGPTSVAYGTNAISGIINLITKSPNEKQISIKSCAGNFNTSSTDFTISQTNEKRNIGILVSGMYKQSDKLELKGKAGDNNWTDLLDNFEIDYSFDIKIKYNDFILGTNYIQKQTSTATLIKSLGTKFKDYGTLWNIRFVNNYLRLSKSISDRILLNSTIYNRNATVLDNTVYYVTDTSQVGYFRPNNLSGVENILTYNITNNISITSGFILEYELLAQKNTSSISQSSVIKPPRPEYPQMEKNYLISAFVEPSMSIFKNIHISAGIRYDYSSIYHQNYTPRAGLSYIFHRHTIRFSYAEAFRAPKPWDYTDGIGNVLLQPEKMKSLEAAITVNLFDYLKLNIIGYKNLLQNAITKQILPNGYYWGNIGEINTTGTEVGMNFLSKKIKASVNYTRNTSLDGYNIFVPEISENTGNASITYALSSHFRLNIRSEYIGRRENPVIISSTGSKFVEPAFILHGVISLLNIKGFDFQFIIKNILNHEYYHTSNRVPERYRQPQRNFLFSIGYSLKY